MLSDTAADDGGVKKLLYAAGKLGELVLSSSLDRLRVSFISGRMVFPSP